MKTSLRHLYPSLLCALIAMFAVPTTAADDVTMPSTTFPPEATGTYTLDKSHAFVLSSVLHMGFSNYYIRFNQFDASLQFDAADVTKSKLDFTVHTGSADSHNSELEAKMQDTQFFNVSKFPTAHFTSTSIEKLSDRTGRITGNLTLLGITKPITLDVVFHGYAVNSFTQTPTLGFSATGSFKRSDFGMIAYVPMVGDEVTLRVETEFNKKP